MSSSDLFVNGQRYDIMSTHLSAINDQIEDSESLAFLKKYGKKWFWYCCAAVFTVKFLLIPCYHSTDFEVSDSVMK